LTVLSNIASFSHNHISHNTISHSKPIQLLSSLSIILKIYMYRWLIVLLILVRIVVDLHCFTPYFIWITTLHCNLDNKGYTSIGILCVSEKSVTILLVENCRFRSFSMCINQVNIFFINNMRTIFSSKKYIYLISPYHIIRWGKTNEPIKPNHKPTLDPINCFFSPHSNNIQQYLYWI
jgi:hypothetical protein